MKNNFLLFIIVILVIMVGVWIRSGIQCYDDAYWEAYWSGTEFVSPKCFTLPPIKAIAVNFSITFLYGLIFLPILYGCVWLISFVQRRTAKADERREKRMREEADPESEYRGNVRVVKKS